MIARACGLLALLALVGLTGCGPGKLDETKSFTLDFKGEPGKSFTLPSQSAEQALTVEVTADHEVDVFVVPAKNQKDFDEAFNYKGRSEKSIASKKGVKTDSLTATVPPNEEVAVAVYMSASNSEKTSVQLKMTNKK